MPVLNSVNRVYVGAPLASAVYVGSNLIWQQSSGAFDFYVDSVNGSDSNNGKSEATAFKSISAIPMSNGITIGLKAGSYWRETLDASGFNNVDVNMYGEGKLPVLDAADVISTTWINDSGNIWYTDVVTADDQYTMYNSLWKDGVRMEWFANTSLLTANNHYYVAEAAAINTYNARFYIYSATDPNTSGALYEYASRHYGATPTTASNMWTPENYWGGTDNYDFTVNGVSQPWFGPAQSDPTFGFLLTDNVCVDYGPSCVVDAANGNFATVAGSNAANLNAGIGATDTVTYTAIPTYAEIDLM